jgi:hypothetical protein
MRPLNRVRLLGGEHTAAGFQTFHQTSATLDVAQRLRVDVNLVVGTANQTVTITSEEPPLQIEESSVGNVMESTALKSFL